MVKVRQKNPPGKQTREHPLTGLLRGFSFWFVEHYRMTGHSPAANHPRIRQLRRSLNQRNLSAFQAPPSETVLLHNQHAHAGLLVLNSGAATSIHDHFESVAVSLLIQGAVTMDFYQLSQRHSEARPSLYRYRSRRLNDACFITPCVTAKKDFHCLQSKERDSIILNFHFPPVERQKRRIAVITEQIDCNLYRCIVKEEYKLMAITKSFQAERKKYELGGVGYESRNPLSGF